MQRLTTERTKKIQAKIHLYMQCCFRFLVHNRHNFIQTNFLLLWFFIEIFFQELSFFHYLVRIKKVKKFKKPWYSSKRCNGISGNSRSKMHVRNRNRVLGKLRKFSQTQPPSLSPFPPLFCSFFTSIWIHFLSLLSVDLLSSFL